MGHGGCQVAPPRWLPPTLPRTRMGGECGCKAGMRSNKQQHTLSGGWSAVQQMMNGFSHVRETNSNYGDLKSKGKNTGIYGRRTACRPRAPGADTHTCVYDKRAIMFVPSGKTYKQTTISDINVQIEIQNCSPSETYAPSQIESAGGFFPVGSAMCVARDLQLKRFERHTPPTFTSISAFG